MSNAPNLPTQDPNDFLMGGSVPSASFQKIGDSVTGTISEEPKLQQQRDFTTGEPKVWDDGNPMMQMVVTLQTEEIDAKIEDDDGRRRIYLKNAMRKAVAEAVRKAGGKRLEVGGRLTVTYTANGEATKKGLQPPKLYSAEYVLPDTAYLNDTRSEDEPAQPSHPRANSNGHWSLEQAKAAAMKAGITYDELVAELRGKGLKGWNPERDTAMVKKFIAAREVFTKEQTFDPSDIPF